MSDPSRSEGIEREALLGWHVAASGRGIGGYDWRIEKIGDALCSVSSTEPSILINRVLGLGSEESPTLEQLKAIRTFYRDAGVSRFFLHVIPDRLGADREQLLADAGYRRYRGWMKFERSPGEIRPGTSDLSVRRIEPDESEAFASIVAPAFDFTPASVPVIAALPDDPDWHLYMSFDGVHPAGTGALYMRERVGYLDFAATDPDFRRRGSQTALLNRRIWDALDAGCTSIVTMTGEAAPGDPQHSYQNILKAGFREAYLRENWIPVDG